ncbi:SDR family NAD(P)-dependent oxidoreductase [Ancylobacter terrae]|uniref:SDR family NAD(P)-dependent oxidoreductase n=1 Tax=Ancylobacter sp. sgz301288 TaxID=3342077 RepID=UPI0038589119
MDRFVGKVVLVTGAGSGIGAAIARRLATEGGHVILADRDGAAAGSVAGALSAEGRAAEPVVLDMTDDDAAARLAGRIGERHGRLDVLVNNAGIHAGGAFQETEQSTWRRLFAVNVEAVMDLSLAMLALLRRANPRGNIVNLSSISGLGGDFGQAAYATSKGAVTHLTRSMALDLAREAIRVNAVCPGSVHTPMFAAAIARLDPGEVEATFARTYPMGRIARPEEIAAAVAFLASDDASFVTGVNLPVDGGLTCHNGAPRFDGA